MDNMNITERRDGYRPKPEPAKHPVFQWPLRPLETLKYLFGFPGYLWPYATFFAIVAFFWWRFLVPPLSEMREFARGWTLYLLASNLALLTLFVGTLHLRLYGYRAQGTDYKYNPSWLATGSDTFLFGSQLKDNIFWSLCSAVPIWTAYEAVTFWLQANGIAPTVSWATHPGYCALLMLLTPVWIDLHFFATHRSLHWAPLFKRVHSLHHKNVNPGPWSGLAMHPVEHLIYFSAVALYWFVPSNPVHVVYLLLYLVLGDIVGHHGFDRLMVGKNLSVNTNHYMHYLHHKYVRVNFGTGVLPFDRLLGTFHDGSEGLSSDSNEERAGVTRRARELGDE
jgi:sterol desaturase/sphingolipid hydroxylase (fatty acid hydroxylase superfamily)